MGLEPLLYGWGAGVSQVAILMSIVFWAWLWGPVGLLLATPLTVCLGVLGKYVPSLTFLEVLLSDEPVTELNRYYQRLVARDQDGALEIVEELLETHTLLDVYEDVVIPALYYTKQDQRHDNLTADEAHAIYRATHELIDDLSASHIASADEVVASIPEEDTAAVLPPPIHILACPAHDEVDEVALRMVQGRPARCRSARTGGAECANARLYWAGASWRLCPGALSLEKVAGQVSHPADRRRVLG
jgi:hypothetical protein